MTLQAIKDATRDCLIRAGTTFRKDQLAAYRKAIREEENLNARWVLERILENAKVARGKRLPLCDDTGIPHVFAEIGENCPLPASWVTGIQEGVAEGLRAMPGRPMAIKGNAVQRVEQSEGLFRDAAKVLPAPMVVKPASGDRLRITVLLLGGGPEIRARTYRVFHKRSMDVVLEEIAGWVIAEAQNLGCTPCVPAIGIGRTHVEASALMLEAMKAGSLNRQSPLEKKVTEMVNATQIGPCGLGGNMTALGSFIKIGPARASGVRIVSFRPCCCVEPRRATADIDLTKRS